MKQLIKDLHDQTLKSYHYFLLLYGVSLYFGLIDESWRAYVSWTRLHTLMTGLTVIVFLHPKRDNLFLRLKKFFTKFYKECVLALAALVASWYFDVYLLDGAVLLYAIGSVLFCSARRLTAGLALALMLSVPLLNALDHIEYANFFATYSFYFLGIAFLSLALENERKLKNCFSVANFRSK